MRLETHADYASINLNLFPPEERGHIYKALGLKANVSADGNIEIRGNFEGGIFPAQKEAEDLGRV